MLVTEGVRTPLSAVRSPVARSVLLTCEAPATVSVLPSVVAPETPSVLLSVVAPETPSVLLSVVAPVTPSVPSSCALLRARNVPLTSRRVVGTVVPMPTSPALVMRSRSLPLVVAVMTLAPPAASDSVPASAVRASEVVPLTVGVRTPPEAVVRPVTPSVPATVASPVASRVVKRPLLAVVAPIEVLLIVPPPIATLLVWNWPPAVTIARTRLLVTSRNSTLFVVPMKLLPRPGVLPSAPLLLVAPLPVRLQAFAVTSAEVEICDSTPVLLAITMRSRPAGMVAAAVPPKLLSVVTPVTPRVPPKLVKLPAATVRLESKFAAPLARKVPPTSNKFVGALRPMPTLPPLVRRRRSAPLVLKATSLAAGRYMPLPAAVPPVGTNLVAVAVPVVARLVPSKVNALPVVRTRLPLRNATPFGVPALKVTAPEAVSAPTLVVPAVTVRPLLSVVAPVTPSVLESVVAPVMPNVPATVALPVASRVVKRPPLAVVTPIEVLLIAPPPIATLLVWNTPPAVMTARTWLLVTNCRFWLLVAPRKSPVGPTSKVAADDVIGLPRRVHAFAVTSAEVDTCDSTPVLLAITMRSSPTGIVVAAVPPRLLSVVTPETPRVLPKVVAPVTPSVEDSVVAPPTPRAPVILPLPPTPRLLSRVVAPVTRSVLLTWVAPPRVVAPVTPSVEDSVVAPLTPSVPLIEVLPALKVPSVEAPVTFSVPPKTPLPEAVSAVVLTPPFAATRPVKVEVPPTARLPLSVVAPPTTSAPLSALSTRTRRPPFTSSIAVGAVVLMPTKPAFAPVPRRRMRSALLVRMARSAASRVPTKLFVGLVPVLPVMAQAVAPTSVAVETCDSSPAESDITTRSRPVRLVLAAPPSEVTVALPVTPRLPPKLPLPEALRSVVLMPPAAVSRPVTPSVLLICETPPTVKALASVVAPVTLRVLLRVEAPATVSVSPRVVAPVTPSVPPKLPVPLATRLVVLMPPLAVSNPVTPKVLLIAEAPATVSVLPRTVAPPTVSAPPTSAVSVTPKEPVRSRVRTGTMPIPTRPPASMRRRSVLAVLKASVLGSGRNMPLPAAVPPVALNLAAVAVPATVTVLLNVAASAALKVPFTSSIAVGLAWLMPTLPPVVMRRRSTPLVVAVMGPPVDCSERVPALAASCSAAPVTSGVVTRLLAVRKVNTPVEGVRLPMAVLLIVPPPRATLLVWNWPAAVKMARTRLPVTIRRSTGVDSSIVPRKLVPAVGIAPSAPPLVVALLPRSVQPELAVSGLIHCNRPPPLVASTLPFPPSSAGSVQTRLAPMASGALKPT